MIDVLHRPGRVVPPARAPEPVVIPAPPHLADTGSGQGFPFQMLMPLVGAGSSMLMMTLIRSNPIFALLGAVMMVVTALGMVGGLLSRRASMSRARAERRENYLDALLAADEEATALAERLRRGQITTNPSPSGLARLATAPERRWERRKSDLDFLHLRLGIANIPTSLAAMAPGAVPTEYDPILLEQAQVIVGAHTVLPRAPLALDLDGAGAVSLIGPRHVTRRIARLLLVEAAVLHAPEDLHIALAYDSQDAEEWDCVSRLPHLRVHGAFDGPTALRRTGATVDDLTPILRPELVEASRAAARIPRGPRGNRLPLTRARLLAVVEDSGPAREIALPDSGVGAADLGVTEIHLVTDRLQEPSDPAVRLTGQEDGSLLVEDLRASEDPMADDSQPPPPVVCAPDSVGIALAEGIGRALSPFSLGRAAERTDDSETTTSLRDLLGVPDPRAIDVQQARAPRSPRDVLRVPIG